MQRTARGHRGVTFAAGPGLALDIPDDGYDGTLASMACVDLWAPYARLGQVLLELAIEHPRADDLTIKLESPSGTVTTLLSCQETVAVGGATCRGESVASPGTSPGMILARMVTEMHPAVESRPGVMSSIRGVDARQPQPAIEGRRTHVMSDSLYIVVEDTFEGNRPEGALDTSLWVPFGRVYEENGKLRLQGTGSHPYVQSAQTYSISPESPLKLELEFWANNHFQIHTRSSAGQLNGGVPDSVTLFFAPGWQLFKAEGGETTGLSGPHWMSALESDQTVKMTLVDDGSTLSANFSVWNAEGTNKLREESASGTYAPFNPGKDARFVGLQGRNGGVVLIDSIKISGTRGIPNLVARWKFDQGPNDLQNAFGELELQGASITGGKLVTGAQKYAYCQGFTGEAIKDKTLVSILTLNNLDVTAGSAITIDAIDEDQFDGIVYAERETRKWMAGSDHLHRTVTPLDPGYQETTTGQRIVMASTYKDMGDNTFEISLYRNGERIGRYRKGPVVPYEAGNTEIVFGARHIMPDRNDVRGAIDAAIEEAMLFDRALSADEIRMIK